MEQEITLTVECEGRLVKGSPDQFDPQHGNWLPGDRDSIDGFKVMLGVLDITKHLTEKEFEKVHDEYLRQLKED